MTFSPGGEFTVGAEDELLLVDAAGQLDVDGATGLIDRLRTRPRPPGVISAELFDSEIEFATPVCHEAGQVADSLAAHRSALRHAGARAMAVGVHPTSPFGDARLTPSHRYDGIGGDLAGLLRTPTASLQVHVGMPDGDVAITAFRGLRHRLALLVALAAGSPFWHGRDSGLASSRWAVLRSYPRTGLPPAVRSWEEYALRVEALRGAAEVSDYTQVWWSLRAQPRLGTLEVRVMDAQPSVEVVAGLVALVQGLARHAVERPAVAEIPIEILEENEFRAARHGLEARIVDTEGVLRPLRVLVREAVHDARSVLAADALDGPLLAIDRLLCCPPEYERQRRVAAEAGLSGMLKDLTERTIPDPTAH